MQVCSGGGGGYGNPLDRKFDDLENDVRQGYVSNNAARRFYGAAFDTQGHRVTGKRLRCGGRTCAGAGCRRTGRVRKTVLPVGADARIALECSNRIPTDARWLSSRPPVA